jgi:hypothetical protein
VSLEEGELEIKKAPVQSFLISSLFLTSILPQL